MGAVIGELAIADFRLVYGDLANWQSGIENWQCRNPSATADGTDLIPRELASLEAHKGTDADSE